LASCRSSASCRGEGARPLRSDLVLACFLALIVVLLWSEPEAMMSKVGCDFFNTAYVSSLASVLDAAMLISSARSDVVGRRL
jgi:hypothetical protein